MENGAKWAPVRGNSRGADPKTGHAWLLWNRPVWVAGVQGGLSKEGEVRQVMEEKRGRLPGAFGPRRDLGPYSLQGLSRELTLLGPVWLPRGLGRSGRSAGGLLYSR